METSRALVRAGSNSQSRRKLADFSVEAMCRGSDWRSPTALSRKEPKQTGISFFFWGAGSGGEGGHLRNPKL